jgi:transcriptional regulator with XRE-family HTH domain
MDGRTTLAFGALLRRYRLAAGLSQEPLAARAGLSVDAIDLLERGRPRHCASRSLSVWR